MFWNGEAGERTGSHDITKDLVNFLLHVCEILLVLGAIKSLLLFTPVRAAFSVSS